MDYTTLRLGPVQRAAPTRAEDTGAAQPPQPTQQPGQIRDAALGPLSGGPAAGASLGVSFRPSRNGSVPDDNLDNLSQRLRNCGFTVAQMDGIGSYERLNKLAEVSGAIKLGPGNFTTDMLTHVAKTEGVQGLQALYDMGDRPDAANLLTQRADAIRRAMRDA